jgi:predicted metal-dependent hydrolase
MSPNAALRRVATQKDLARDMDRRTARTLIERLNRDAEQIARHFGLRYKSITAERANVTSRYGSCCEDGGIKIRLRHAVTGKPLKYSSLVNTLCHELAHLRYFHHGERFRVFYLQILEYARSQRLYRPGAAAAARPALRPPAPAPPEPPGPVQLGLF